MPNFQEQCTAIVSDRNEPMTFDDIKTAMEEVSSADDLPTATQLRQVTNHRATCVRERQQHVCWLHVIFGRSRCAQ